MPCSPRATSALAAPSTRASSGCKVEDAGKEAHLFPRHGGAQPPFARAEARLRAGGGAARLQGRQRGRSRPRPRLLQAAPAAGAVRGGAVPGPHAACHRHARAIRSSCISRWTKPSASCSSTGATAAAIRSASTISTCSARDVQASIDFYAALGFRLTEYTESDDAEPRIAAAWMHRKGGVHDLAFTNGRGPRLHHFAYWVPGVLNVDPPVRRDGDHRLSRQHGARTRPPRHRQRFLPLRARPRRPPHRASMRRTISPSIPTSSRSAGPCAIRAVRRSGARRRPQSWFEEGSVFPGTPVLPPVHEF